MTLTTHFLAGAGALLLAFAPAAQAQLIYTSGHMDLGVTFDEHEEKADFGVFWNVDHGANLPAGAYAPSAVVGLFTTLASPSEDIRAGLGGASGPVYFVDLGFGGELHAHHPFADDELTVTLVSAVGAGDVVVSKVFSGVDYLYFSSFDAALTGEDNLLRLSLEDFGGGRYSIHEHYNWYFSEEGRYDITLRWEGMLGGSLISSQETFTMYAGSIPEPRTYLLLLSCGAGLLAFRRWRSRSLA